MSRSDLIIHLMKDGKQRSTVEIMETLYHDIKDWQRTYKRSNIYETLRKLEQYKILKRCGRNDQGCLWVIV